MPLGNRGWKDQNENYCDGYVLKINGSSATGVLGQSFLQPAVIYGLSLTFDQNSSATGLVDIIDSSATGAADPTIWSVQVNGVSTGNAVSLPFQYVMPFPRGLACNNGIVVTATTVTGSISILYKARYS